MAMLTRRNALKQFAMLPFAGISVLNLISCRHSHGPAASSAAGLATAKSHPCDKQLASEANPGLNVFLHGLFLISTKNTLFDIYTPVVTGSLPHVYKAGGWTKEQQLTQNSKIYLTGINPGDMPSFSNTEHFKMPQATADTIDPATSYFSGFQLPFPIAANPPKFRRKLGRPIFHQFLLKDAQHDDLAMRPKSVPLVYVFVYPQSQFTGAASDIKLMMDYQGRSTEIWHYDPSSSDPFPYDLHIDASPDHCTDDSAAHLTDAFDSLNKMFKPNLTLALYDPRGSVPGNFNCDEDESLAERSGTCNGRDKGGEVANCTAFILGG
jgi:hypothetical protein